jgi:hypothetical protein
MAENGDIPSTGDPRVDAALQRIRGKFRDLEDAMLVQVHLEKRATERIKEHAEWIAAMHEGQALHEKALRRHQEWLAEVEDKVNFLIDREMRRQGGPESTA